MTGKDKPSPRVRREDCLVCAGCVWHNSVHVKNCDKCRWCKDNASERKSRKRCETRTCKNPIKQCRVTKKAKAKASRQRLSSSSSSSQQFEPSSESRDSISNTNTPDNPQAGPSAASKPPPSEDNPNAEATTAPGTSSACRTQPPENGDNLRLRSYHLPLGSKLPKEMRQLKVRLNKLVSDPVIGDESAARSDIETPLPVPHARDRNLGILNPHRSTEASSIEAKTVTLVTSEEGEETESDENGQYEDKNDKSSEELSRNRDVVLFSFNHSQTIL